MEVHIVVRGDTLWKIARQYGIPFDELKRVNAHLANPDYIVPGMKIFLPKKSTGEKHQGSVGEKHENVKQPDKGKMPVQPTPTPKPIQKPIMTPKPTPVPPPKGELELPPIPVTLPPAPAPAPIPTPLPRPAPPPPPTQMQPTAPMPVPPPVMQMMPMPQYIQPIINIPCCCMPMPIHDADCHPFMHTGQIQAMPMPQMPVGPAPMSMQMPMQMPMPLPSTQFPMYEPEVEESTIFESPAAPPTPSPVMEGWQLVESPELLFDESPETLYDESPMIGMQPSVPCPPEQGYVPQALSPASQYNYPMASMHHHAHHAHHAHHGYGCGCSGHQPMMAPLHYGHLCNCNQFTQSPPFQMMPVPYQNTNWYGAY